jgi:hypothetical protein
MHNFPTHPLALLLEMTLVMMVEVEVEVPWAGNLYWMEFRTCWWCLLIDVIDFCLLESFIE